MTSGYGEEWTTKLLNQSSTEAKSLHDFLDMDNTLLLHVVIGLCAVIILLLSCILYFICKKNISCKKNCKVNTFSKATSVTDLNQSTITGEKDSSIKSKQQPIDTDINLNGTVVKFHKPRKSLIVTSSTTTEKFSSECLSSFKNNKKGHKTISDSPVLFPEDGTSNYSLEQCKTSDNDRNHSAASMTQNTSNVLTAPSLQCTSTSNVLNESVPLIQPTQQLITHSDNDGDEHASNKNSDLLSATSHSSILLDNDKPLSLNVHEQPKAWFVPLGEMPHEPIRHSYIDISKYQDGRLNENIEEPLMKNYMPNDFDKKPSAWEQREDRPVMFLGNLKQKSSETFDTN